MRMISLLLFLVLLFQTPPSFGFGIITTQAQWDTQEVKVCFEETDQGYHEKLPILRDFMKGHFRPWSASEKQEIQGWIEKEYNSKNLGIFFSGFNSCADTGSFTHTQELALVAVTEEDDHYGVATLGDQNAYPPEHPEIKGLPRRSLKGRSERFWNGVVLNFDLTEKNNIHFVEERFTSKIIRNYVHSTKALPIRSQLHAEVETLSKELRKWTLLHEIGHALGLFHEDRRKEEYVPPWSDLRADDHGRAEIEKKDYPYSTEMTEFDYFSIMNYVNQSALRGLFILKQICALKDISTLDPSFHDIPNSKEVLSHCPEAERLTFQAELSSSDIYTLQKTYLKKPPPAKDPALKNWTLSPYYRSLNTLLSSLSRCSTFYNSFLDFDYE